MSGRRRAATNGAPAGLRWTMLIALALATGSARGDWQVKRTAGDPRVARAMIAALRRDPFDRAALARLGSLSPARRSSLEALVVAHPAATRFADWIIGAHLAQARGDDEEAARRYRSALDLHPDARLRIALAAIDERLHREPESRAQYEAALESLACRGRGAPCLPVLRRLADLAIAAGDHRSARGYLARLVAISPTNGLVRELAEQVVADGEPAQAARLWEGLAKRGRTAAMRAEAWARVAALRLAASDLGGARAANARVLAEAPTGSGLRREAFAQRLAIERRPGGDLARLLVEAEAVPKARRDPIAWEAIAQLKEALGDLEGAAAADRQAIEREPRAMEPRRHLVTMLGRLGRSAELATEERRFLAIAPADFRARVELAERLAESGAGGRIEARRRLDDTAARFPNDPAAHRAVAAALARLGDEPAALAEEERALALSPDDAGRIQLGTRWLARGDRERALAAWSGLSGEPPTTERLRKLADVLAEHDFAPEAIEAYRHAHALAPDDEATARALALACERAGRLNEAEAAWLDLARASSRGAARGEARRQAVAVFSRAHRLAERTTRLSQAFAGPAPEVETGLVLGEALREGGSPAEAERVFERVASLARTDAERADALVGVAETARVDGHLAVALAALQSAAAIAPERAADLWSDAADLALALHHDDEALSLATRAEAKSPPGDARGAMRLASILEQRGDDAAAAAALARAIGREPRRTEASRALARLTARAGRFAEAETMEAALATRAGDEETVLQAGRRAIALSALGGRLAALPNAFSSVKRRSKEAPSPADGARDRLLVELYDRMATDLVERARAGDGEARRDLVHLREAALFPLERATRAGDASLARLAAVVLRALAARSTASTLLRIATAPQAPTGPSTPASASAGSSAPLATRSSQAVVVATEPSIPIEVRIIAALAAAPYAGEGDVPALRALLHGDEKLLGLAAIDGLSAVRGAGADQALAEALDSADVDVEAAACSALAARSRGGAPGPWRARAERIAVSEGGAIARAACALALPDGDVKDLEPIRKMSADRDAMVREAAAIALGRARDRASQGALLSRVFTDEERVRRAAARALRRIEGTRAAGRPWSEPAARHSSLVEDHDEPRRGRERLRAMLDDEAGLPNEPAGAWLGDADLAARAIVAGLDGPPTIALRTLSDLDGHAHGLSLDPLLPPPETLPPTSRAACERLLDEIAKRIAPSLEKLARRQATAAGNSLVAARALDLVAKLRDPPPDDLFELARRSTDAAARRAAVALAARAGGAPGQKRSRIEALANDPAPSVRAAARSALAHLPSP